MKRIDEKKFDEIKLNGIKRANESKSTSGAPRGQQPRGKPRQATKHTHATLRSLLVAAAEWIGLFSFLFNGASATNAIQINFVDLWGHSTSIF